VDDLIGCLYEAAIERKGWPEFLGDLATEAGAEAMTLVTGSAPEACLHDLTVSVGTDPQVEARYSAYYGSIDPYPQAGSLETAVGDFAPTERWMPEADFVRTEFYNDYQRPNGWLHGFALPLMRDPGGRVAMVIGLRSKQRGIFGAETKQTLLQMLPHLQRALRIHDQLEIASLEQAASARVIDGVSVGVILVDERGRVVRTNSIADSIMAAEDGLQSRPSGLEGATTEQTAVLQYAIGDAAVTTQGRGTGAGGRLTLARPSGLHPYVVEVSPLDREAPLWGTPRAVAAILVSDGSPGALPSAGDLQRLYELTPAEAELVLHLARGLSLEQTAEQRGVAVNTVRSQLKRVFAKTNTNRQADLIRLVLGVSTVFREDQNGR
jgi:DNA-binding CsgD family transcriptional regulator